MWRYCRRLICGCRVCLFEFAHRSARRVSMILSSTTHEWAVRYALPLTDVVKNRAPSEHAPAAAARFLPEA